MCGEDGFAITVPDAVKKSSKYLVYVICKSLTGNSQAAVWKKPTQECKFKRGDHWGGQETKKLNFALAVQSSFNAYYMGQCITIPPLNEWQQEAKSRWASGVRNGKNNTWGTLRIIIRQTKWVTDKKDPIQGCHEESNGVARAGEKCCCWQDSEKLERFGALLCRCSDGLTVLSCYLHLSLIKLIAQSIITRWPLFWRHTVTQYGGLSCCASLWVSTLSAYCVFFWF